MEETPTEEFPSEISDLALEMQAAKLAQIEALGKQVAKKRDEAVKARKASGIEQIWTEDREAYEGIDDLNRDQVTWFKSPSATGGMTRNAAAKNSSRCTQFFPITRQFCESASARMGDILLPASDKNYSVKPTPVPEPSAAPALGMGAAPSSGPQASGAAPNPDVNAKAEKAETWIWDKLVECSYHTEVRKVIEDAAIIGVGVLKGPVPEKTTAKRATQGEGGTGLTVEISVSPVSKRVDPWDFFPDPNCGEDIHKGSYVCERDYLVAKDLQDFKGMKEYLADRIDKVLEEGPGKRNLDGRYKKNTTDAEDEYEIWYFHGLVDVSQMAAMVRPDSADAKLLTGMMEGESSDAKKKFVSAIVTLVNDTAIKATLAPLDSGDFPYDVMPWQRMAGSWAGIGVSRQMRTAQNLYNASGRALADNMGLSSAPQIVMRQNGIVPADGKWEISARKLWFATEQADVRSVQDAILAINIPSMQNEHIANMKLAKEMAEDATGIFFLMQGQQGSAPDTVGGMELLQRNASAILRRLARVFDERITEPHIRRYYEWLMMYGPDDCKGDMQIQAIGSTALVEREIQSMQAMQLLQLSLNPSFGLDPAKAMQEVLKAQRFIPDKWVMDPDKAKQQAENPPAVPAIEVAKINAQTATQLKQMDLQQREWEVKVKATGDQHRIEADIDRDTSYNQSLAERDQMNAQVRIEELRLKKELAVLDYSAKHNVAIEQIKAGLASDAMKLKVQKELAGIKQVTEPPTEPPQRAEDGHAFEQ